MALFDFIKKQPATASDSPSNGQPVAGQTQTTVTVTESQPVQSSGQQAYNGIGSPPGGGNTYNGIGSPPAAPVTTAPSSVAGNPPVETTPASVQVTQTTTTTPDTPPVAPVDDPNNPKSNEPGAPDAPQAPADPNAPKPEGTDSKTPDGQPAADSANPQDQKRMDMDVMTHLTQRSNRVFLSANNKAKELMSPEVDSEHLLHGLLSDPEIYKMLTAMKIQPQLVDQELDKVYKKGTKPDVPQIAPRVKRILDNSLIIARKLGFEFISPEHLLVATYDEGEGVAAQILKKMNLSKEELNKKITGKKEGLDEKGGDGQAKKSAIAQFTIDLTAKAEQGLLDPVVGRSDVIERIIHIMSRRLKNNPVLIGEPGVGKTAVVEGLAQKIVARQVPEQLLGKRIMQLDLMSVIAGASHRGEFEERMKNLVEEVKEGKGQVILFIDEIHTIVGAGGGGEGSLDASNFIKPALSRGELQMIGATTITEYKRIEKDAALERRFQSVLVPEPTEEQAIKMLKALRDKFEAFHRVKIPDESIEAAVKLSKRYMGDRFLPDKAVDLIDESASAVRLPLMSLPEEIKNVEERIAQIKQERDESDKRGDKVRVRIMNSKLSDIEADLNSKKDEYNMRKAQTTTSVTTDIIKDIIAKRTGIPVSKISSSEQDKIVRLEDIMHERLIGQERPVKSVAQAVRRGRAGLKANARPIGSFVFLGPSGVGKTELAKTLAEILFGQEEAMIRFDMTEFMEKHEVAKLLGPPPGYVGYEEGGKLTEAVRRRQYAVVLFDEVEKAHPDIFNILLQILDDGRLTDNKGRTISFKNTVVICTSNIGTKMIQDELLKQNKGQVEEPPVLSTYAFSPRGREILSIGTKFFERDVTGGKATNPAEKTDPKANAQGQNGQGATSSTWTEGVLFDYFAGQKIEKAQPAPAQAAANPADPNAPQPAPAPAAAPTDNADAQFPVMGYDTHTISSKGVEMISRDSIMFIRNATTAKVWNAQNLIDYFKDNVVINALPDAPDEQLPTVRLKTHTFTPDEKEIVSYRDRFWRRKEGSTDWETGYLKDYFIDGDIKEGSFPVTHWDIHTFSPTGKEVIIVGESIWSKEPGTPDKPNTMWKLQKLEDYFGKDFPLEQEIDEKTKIENESEAKKYDVIKEKVMNELLKFFRPELVNRFDEVIVFEPLKFSHMIQIVKLQLKALTKLLEEQELGFTFTDEAVKEIVRSGFDPVYGARPLRRAIQRLVENPISELIIAQKVRPGNFIYLDWDGDKFIFDIESTDILADKSKDPKNFTALDVIAFVEKTYPQDKEAIMKDLTKYFPEYAKINQSTIKPDEAVAPKSVAAAAPKDKQSDIMQNLESMSNTPASSAPPANSQPQNSSNGVQSGKPQANGKSNGVSLNGLPPQQPGQPVAAYN